MVKINRCILKHTEDQLEAAYQAVKSWAKQHATFIENDSGDDFWEDVRECVGGFLRIYWPAFITEEAAKFALENGRGRVFEFRDGITCDRELWGAIILDMQELNRKKAREQHGYWLIRVERKYLRWVRRHF